MDNNRLISALSYFSIFFAPLIVPIVIWFIVKDKKVRHHAKSAVFSHLLLYVLIFSQIFSVSVFGFVSYSSPNASGDSVFIGYTIFLAILGITALFIVIWNIIRGIKVLSNKEAV